MATQSADEEIEVAASNPQSGGKWRGLLATRRILEITFSKHRMQRPLTTADLSRSIDPSHEGQQKAASTGGIRTDPVGKDIFGILATVVVFFLIWSVQLSRPSHQLRQSKSLRHARAR